jgi:hypothetical protein
VWIDSDEEFAEFIKRLVMSGYKYKDRWPQEPGDYYVTTQKRNGGQFYLIEWTEEEGKQLRGSGSQPH